MNGIDNLINKSLYRPTDGFRFSNASGTDFDAQISSLQKKIDEYNGYIDNANTEISKAKAGLMSANTSSKRSGFQNTINEYTKSRDSFVVNVKDWKVELSKLKQQKSDALKAETNPETIKAKAEADSIRIKADNSKYYVIGGGILVIGIIIYLIKRKNK